MSSGQRGRNPCVSCAGLIRRPAGQTSTGTPLAMQRRPSRRPCGDIGQLSTAASPTAKPAAQGRGQPKDSSPTLDGRRLAPQKRASRCQHGQALNRTGRTKTRADPLSPLLVHLRKQRLQWEVNQGTHPQVRVIRGQLPGQGIGHHHAKEARRLGRGDAVR